MWRPESLFYRYFAGEVMRFIGIEFCQEKTAMLGPVVCAAKIPLPRGPLLSIVKERRAS